MGAESFLWSDHFWERSLNFYGQPIMAVGSILVGLVILALLPIAERRLRKDRRSRDR